MKHIEYTRDGSKINLSFLGRIDSGNVPEIESMISEILDQGIPESIVIDLDKLDYISSAGLRVILKLKKKVADIVLINASPEVYDIFEMTGFSQMMDISDDPRIALLAEVAVVLIGLYRSSVSQVIFTADQIAVVSLL